MAQEIHDIDSMTTKQIAEFMMNLYLKAEIAIINGAQSYSISGKTITRANLNDVINQRKYWERKLARCNGKGGRRSEQIKVIY